MLRGFLTIVSGGGVRQVVVLAALPVLGRLYGPESFGQLGAVMAIVSMAVVVVHGRYHIAIPVARDDAEARALLATALGLAALLSLPVAASINLVFGTAPDGLSLVGTIALAAALTFLGAFIDIMTFWRSRAGRFGVSARNDAGRAIGTVGIQFALAATPVGLVLGSLGGSLSAAAMALKDGWKDAFVKLDLAAIRAVASRYRAYPLFGVPQGWLAALSWNVLPLLLLRFGGTALAGQYWLAYRLLLTPVALVGSAYRQVALPRLAKGDAAANRRDVARHTLVLAALGVAPVSLLFIHGEALFALLLGDVWMPAGALAGWLAVGLLADTFKIPAATLLQRDGRQSALLVWEAAIGASRYLLAIPLLVNGETTAAVAAFACAGFAGWSLFTLGQTLFVREARHA